MRGNLYREIASGDERNKKQDAFLLKLLPLLLLVAVFTVISSSMIAGNTAKGLEGGGLNAYLTNTRQRGEGRPIMIIWRVRPSSTPCWPPPLR